MTTKSPDLMYLYNLPQNVDGGVPIYGLKNDKGEDIVVCFGHLDGMYSYCWVQNPEAPKDETDQLIHLAATTPIMYDYETEQYSVAEEK